MTLKTNKYQIGQSATASNNFVLKTDGAGALQICRGNLGDEGDPLLTIDADDNVKANVPIATGPGEPISSDQTLSFGQSWQNLTSQRVIGTDYPNDTDKPIIVAVGITSSEVNKNVVFYISGNVVQVMNNPVSGTTLVVGGIVPPGLTYRVSTSNSSPTLQQWVEYRDTPAS